VRWVCVVCGIEDGGIEGIGSVPWTLCYVLCALDDRQQVIGDRLILMLCYLPGVWVACVEHAYLGRYYSKIRVVLCASEMMSSLFLFL